MPRPCREFSQHEIQQVRQMQQAGESRANIAKTLGITSCSFAWHLQCGRFGNLTLQPGRRAGGKGKLQRADIEEKGQVLGCPQEEWQLRQIEVRDSWPPDERKRRFNQEVPNRSDNYSLFRQNNPNHGQNKPTQQNTFHDRRNRPH